MFFFPHGQWPDEVHHTGGDDELIDDIMMIQ